MFTTIDGRSIYYESRGDGDAVVFIHGLGGTSSIWFAQAQGLASRRRTIAFDWLGSGCSERADSRFSVDAWADEAAKLCKNLGVARAVFVGHSLGCAVAVTIAARFPDLALGIALAGPVVKLPDAAIGAINDRKTKVLAEGMAPLADALPTGALSENTRKTAPVVHAFYRSLILSNDPKIYAAHCDALLGAAADQLLGQVRCPSLLLAGENDPTAPVAAVESIAARIKGSKFVTIADAGHAMQLDHPEKVSAELESFLESIK